MNKNPFILLRSALNTLFGHPVIFFPFCLFAFIQVLVLEILFFSVRYPLSVFFGPWIRRLSGEIYMHYPNNFALLQRWFSQGWMQVPLYVMFYSFFIGMAVLIINAIDSHQKISLKNIYRRTFACYVHLIVAAALVVETIYGLSMLYRMLILQAVRIPATGGIDFLVKQLILEGVPFGQLLIGCIATTVLAFVVPMIMLEKKSVFTALLWNFKKYWRAMGVIFVVVVLSALLYVPVILLKTYQQWYETFRIPELWGLILVLGVVVMIFIDALQVTAITTYYLFTKESGT